MRSKYQVHASVRYQPSICLDTDPVVLPTSFPQIPTLPSHRFGPVLSSFRFLAHAVDTDRGHRAKLIIDSTSKLASCLHARLNVQISVLSAGW